MNKYWVFIVIFMFSCQGKLTEDVKDKTIIPVAKAVDTGEILNLSDYAKSVKYIPLETNDSLLVGDIEQFVYEKDRIIFYDFQTETALLFKSNGCFICQIGRKGEGAREYRAVKRFNVINKLNLLFLDAYPRRFYLYDLNGNFIKNVLYPDYPKTYIPWQTIALDSINYFSDLTSPEHLYYRGLFFNSEMMDKNKLFRNYIDLNKKQKKTWGGYDGAHIWNYRDTIRYYRSLNDTVYTITSALDINKTFIFDYGVYKAPPQSLINSESIEKYIVLYANGIKESSRYLFFDFYFGQYAPEKFKRTFRTPRGQMVTREFKNVYGLFDKNTGCLALLNQPIKKQLGFRNDIDGGPTFWPKYISSDDEMVDYWNAEDFLKLYEQLENPSPELKKIAEKLTPDDNPILMVVTLK